MKKIKISELPESRELKGLHTIGTDAENRSVKVPLELIQEKADEAKAAAKEATVAATRAGNAADNATESKNKAHQAANKAEAAARRKEIIPFVTRGCCHTQSKPGYAYRANHGANNRFRVIVSEFKHLNFWGIIIGRHANIAKAFPNGKYYDFDIEVHFNEGIRGSYDKETGNIWIEDTDPRAYKEHKPLCWVGINTDNPAWSPEIERGNIMVDEDGRVVKANVRQPERYDVNLDGIPFDLCLNDLHLLNEKLLYQDGSKLNREKCLHLYLDWRAKGDAVNGNYGTYVELQRLKKVQIGKKDNTYHRYIKKWCHMTHKLPSRGIIRARLHTKSGRVSSWKYYSYIYNVKYKEMHSINKNNFTGKVNLLT